MPIPITMPRLSDTMEAGTIIKWNVKEGDKVSAGDVIADVETDKATMEMSVYDDGTVAKISVPEGKPVNVGTVIAVLAGQGEDVKEAAKAAGNGAAAPAPSKKGQQAPADKPRAERVPAAAAGPEQRKAKHAGSAPSSTADARAEPEEEAAPKAAGDGRIFVSPMARRLAEQHHVELRSIEGSGPGGRIIKRDVLKAVDAAKEATAAVPPSARQQPAAPDLGGGVGGRDQGLATRVAGSAPAQAFIGAAAPGIQPRSIQLSGMRQTIAKRLVESKSTIPHYQITVTFDMDRLMDLRATLNEQLQAQNVKLSVNDFLVRACALAMYQHPEFNSTWGGDHIDIHGEINIGIAISVPAERGGGLVVATIRNADQKSLRVISYESKMLAEKARTRGLTIQEMSDTTFTISNLGMYGVDNFSAIINPPNVAILAVGAALKKPVVRNDQLIVGQEMSGTLSCDHRVIDGAMAAEYLQTLKQLIENPGTLLV